VGLVPYSPLGRGFLTGTIHAQDLGPGDFRHTIPRFAEGALEANQQMADAVRQVAGELTQALGRETTPAQVALAWLYGQGRAFGLAVVPIPGTRRAERIDENLGALALDLTPAQREVLGKAADAVVGFRAKDPSWVSQGRE
jgi:aryl-alcohol dehydrogenase-like predicted oxidoreductase